MSRKPPYFVEPATQEPPIATGACPPAARDLSRWIKDSFSVDDVELSPGWGNFIASFSTPDYNAVIRTMRPGQMMMGFNIWGKAWMNFVFHQESEELDFRLLNGRTISHGQASWERIPKELGADLTRRLQNGLLILKFKDESDAMALMLRGMIRAVGLQFAMHFKLSEARTM